MDADEGTKAVTFRGPTRRSLPSCPCSALPQMIAASSSGSAATWFLRYLRHTGFRASLLSQPRMLRQLLPTRPGQDHGALGVHCRAAYWRVLPR
jgi:hypothetical protein